MACQWSVIQQCTCCCCSSIFFSSACCCLSPWSSSSRIDADSLCLKICTHKRKIVNYPMHMYRISSYAMYSISYMCACWWKAKEKVNLINLQNCNVSSHVTFTCTCVCINITALGLTQMALQLYTLQFRA